MDYGIVYLVLLSLHADSVNYFKKDLTSFGVTRILSMIIKHIFTEPETEVKLYFDSIEEIVTVIVYQRQA